MSIQYRTRKRIWEVDCLSLDACLAASYEWRELANLLKIVGHEINASQANPFLEMRIHNLVHAYCHFENPLSLRIEMLLGLLHNDTVCEVEVLDKPAIDALVQNVDFRNKRKFAALTWALASEPRDEVAGAKRFLHQMFQVLSIRHSQAPYTSSQGTRLPQMETQLPTVLNPETRKQ